jgi:hypothetical protein
MPMRLTQLTMIPQSHLSALEGTRMNPEAREHSSMSHISRHSYHCSALQSIALKQVGQEIKCGTCLRHFNILHNPPSHHKDINSGKLLLRENFADSEDIDPRRSHPEFFTLM